MSAVVGLGPLLDPGALWAIARTLLSARERLRLRVGQAVPTAGQLALSLHHFIQHHDSHRAHAAASPTASSSVPIPPSASRAQLVHKLRRLIVLADASYAPNEEAAHARLQEEDVHVGFLEARWMSAKFHPAYYIAYDPILESVILCVRGSSEVSDFITNLTVDTERFANGFGHGGIVKATQNLATTLGTRLETYVSRMRPRNGITVIGHSLGGGVASLFTIALRNGFVNDLANRGTQLYPHTQLSMPEPTTSDFDRVAIENCLRHAECYSFSGPPCLSRQTAADAHGVTTIVLGLDMVPRLCVASVDRLLQALSRYDWASDVSRSTHTAVTGAATPLLGAAGAAAAAGIVVEHGAAGAALAADAIGGAARRSLAAQNPSQGVSPAWRLVLAATAVGAHLIKTQFFNEDATPRANAQTAATRDYSFARQFGMTPEEVETTLVHSDDGPQQLFLPGRVLHVDLPFTAPDSYDENDPTLPPARLVERPPEYFQDVEASAWMIHHHVPRVINAALSSLLPAVP